MTGTRNEAVRNAWLERAIKAIPAGCRILDAGAGEQRHKVLCDHLVYVAQDFGQYDGDGDHTGLQTGSWDQSALDIVGDITDIAEPDASFDAILCTEVLEHLPDPISAIREFSRLLRKDGILILTAPFSSLSHFSPYHYYTGFNKSFYEVHLAANNFRILELNANGNFFEYLAQELRRITSISGKYSNDSPTRIERYFLRVILKMLGRFSSKDHGSSELLCYGYHVLGKKQ